MFQDLRFGVRMLAKNPGFTAEGLVTRSLFAKNILRFIQHFEIQSESEQNGRSNYRAKFNSRYPTTVTGSPPFVAGLKRILRAASMAVQVSPASNPSTTSRSLSMPSRLNITRNLTVPVILLLRAASVYFPFS